MYLLILKVCATITVPHPVHSKWMQQTERRWKICLFLSYLLDKPHNSNEWSKKCLKSNESNSKQKIYCHIWKKKNTQALKHHSENYMYWDLFPFLGHGMELRNLGDVTYFLFHCTRIPHFVFPYFFASNLLAHAHRWRLETQRRNLKN